MDQLVLGGVIVCALVALVRWPERYEVTSVLLIVTLVFTGLLSPEEAVGGFASTATLSVAGLFVISAGLMRTGAPLYLVDRLSALSEGHPLKLLAALSVVIPLASAFMSNTAVVVLFIPVLLTLCRRFGLSPSKFLMPVSFLSILGGTCTLIGTSTNLLIHGLYLQEGGDGFGLFEFTGPGVLYMLVGAAYILLLGPRILPDHQVVSSVLDPEQRREYVTEVVVGQQSELVGVPVAGVTGRFPEMQVLELVRGETLHWPPFDDLSVQAGDLLVVRTPPQAILEAVGRKSFQFAPEVGADQVRSVETRLIEVLILPSSAFLGQRLREIELHRRFNVTVLGIQRAGHHLRSGLADVQLHVGDMLLVQADPTGVRRLGDRPEDFVVLDQIRQRMVDVRRVPLAIAILAAVVLMVTFGVRAHIAALFGAGAMVLTGCLRTDDAIRSLDFSVLMLLAATIPLGLAMERTGLANEVAEWVLLRTGGWGPTAQIVVFFGLTSLLSSFLSNNATAVLMTPIALSTAAALGMAPEPLLVAIVFGASACFATPIGYQTNVLVLAPGGYRFVDYVRFGLPLTLLLLAMSAVIIPLFWPV